MNSLDQLRRELTGDEYDVLFPPNVKGDGSPSQDSNEALR